MLIKCFRANIFQLAEIAFSTQGSSSKQVPSLRPPAGSCLPSLLEVVQI